MNENISKIKSVRDSKGRFIPGFKHTEESKLKIKQNNSKFWLGKKRPEMGKIMTRVHTGNKYSVGIKRSEEYKDKLRKYTGEKNSRWLVDRSLLKKDDREGNPAYREWRKQVYARDNYTCKINNADCKGKKEAHHILSWRAHKDLRYVVNNGITLCQFHHPRKREEEKNLSPYFQSLLN